MPRTAFEKSSHTSLNSITVYRQEAAGRLAEMRQLLSPLSHSNKGRNQEDNSMSSKDQQASPPSGQHAAPDPASGSEHAVEPSGQREIIPQPPVRARQRFNPAFLKIVLAVSIRPRLRMSTRLRALHAKSEHAIVRPNESESGVATYSLSGSDKPRRR